MIIKEIPRFIALTYNLNETIRWNSIYFFLSAVSLISIHYAIMFYFGLKMHFNMKQQLLKFSSKNRKLQRQFFKALIFQSIGPTVLLVLPAVPVLLCPVVASFFHFFFSKFSWQTGWLYSFICFYPPFDSISFLMIVTEYRNIIHGLKKIHLIDLISFFLERYWSLLSGSRTEQTKGDSQQINKENQRRHVKTIMN